MNHKKSIEAEIQRTMSSLEGMQRVPGNPWLFTRIQAKMESKEIAKPSITWRPALSWAAFCVLLLANGMAIVSATRTTSKSNEQQLVQAVSKQYGFQQDATWSMLQPQH
ncbi:MAG: hypothetical protein GC192_19985 [Bacteroidetes bacterium]|nr:hypothetical protein [Bacteroidota bacterium]